MFLVEPSLQGISISSQPAPEYETHEDGWEEQDGWADEPQAEPRSTVVAPNTSVIRPPMANKTTLKAPIDARKQAASKPAVTTAKADDDWGDDDWGEDW